MSMKMRSLDIPLNQSMTQRSTKLQSHGYLFKASDVTHEFLEILRRGVALGVCWEPRQTILDTIESMVSVLTQTFFHGYGSVLGVSASRDAPQISTHSSMVTAGWVDQLCENVADHMILFHPHMTNRQCLEYLRMKMVDLWALKMKNV